MPLVVAYDGSHDAKLALRWVAEESLRTGAPVRVLAVNELLAPTWGGVGGPIVVTETYVRDCTGLLGEAEKELAAASATSRPRRARATWSTRCSTPRTTRPCSCWAAAGTAPPARP